MGIPGELFDFLLMGKTVLTVSKGHHCAFLVIHEFGYVDRHQDSSSGDYWHLRTCHPCHHPWVNTGTVNLFRSLYLHI